MDRRTRYLLSMWLASDTLSDEAFVVNDGELVFTRDDTFAAVTRREESWNTQDQQGFAYGIAQELPTGTVQGWRYTAGKDGKDGEDEE
jgi:hypothetical protein